MTEQTTVITKEGFTVLKNDSHISRWVEHHKRLDIQDGQITPWLNDLPADGFAIDIGAFIGDTAASISKKLGKSGLLLCLEPSIDGFECLVKNIRFMGPCEIKCYNVGAGNEKALAAYKLDPNAGASHLAKEAADSHLEVLTLPLDDIIAETTSAKDRKVDFIKIDVEGWELDVLKGAEKTIVAHHPVLLIEVNQGALERQGTTPDEIYAFLSAHGYSYQITSPHCNFGDPQFDIYCTHAGKGARIGSILR